MSADPEAGRRPRVLFLSWRDRSHPEGGGSEMYVERMAQAMSEGGWDVTVLCASYPGAARAERLGTVRFVRRGGRYSVYLRAAMHVLGRPDRYDVIVDIQNGVPFWTPLLTSAPVVLLIHHVHKEQWPVVFGPWRARLGWWLESRVAPAVYGRSRYVTVSEATRSELAGLGVDPAHVDVIYAGNDSPGEFDVAEGPGRPEPPSMVILGRLVPHKRVEIAIDALASLRERFPTLTLDVVGSGYWHDELRAHAQRRGVTGAVRFRGFVTEATKHRLLADASVNLMPSLKEGWGLAVVEAAAHGTPSVAFRAAGGTAESVVHGRTGLLADDPAQFTDHVASLLSDPQLRDEMGAAARRYAGQFTWTSTGEQFRALVESVRFPAPAGAAALPAQPPTATDGDPAP
ncbi:MAG TPA: glycosyltransferase family 4 protein [Jiangellaceae bacterium]|nr:glycosyltransferase family 4 protein [Jiangellaceae bacterium]